MKLRPLLHSLLLAGFAAVLCPAALAEKTKNEPPPANVPIKLKRGASFDEVRAVLGEPVEVKKGENEGAKFEVWIYSQIIRQSMRPVAVGMKDVPYVEPISGVMKMVQEPDFRNQQILTLGITMVKFRDGKMVDCLRTIRESQGSIL